ARAADVVTVCSVVVVVDRTAAVVAVVAAADPVPAVDAAAMHPVSPRTPATLRTPVTTRARAAGCGRRRRVVVGEWRAVMGMDDACPSSGRPWSAQGDRPGNGVVR